MNKEITEEVAKEVKRTTIKNIIITAIATLLISGVGYYLNGHLTVCRERHWKKVQAVSELRGVTQSLRGYLYQRFENEIHSNYYDCVSKYQPSAVMSEENRKLLSEIRETNILIYRNIEELFKTLTDIKILFEIDKNSDLNKLVESVYNYKLPKIVPCKNCKKIEDAENYKEKAIIELNNEISNYFYKDCLELYNALEANIMKGF